MSTLMEALYEPAPPKQEGTKGPRRKKGDRLPKMKQWAEDATQPWSKLKFNNSASMPSWRSRRFKLCTTQRAAIGCLPLC